MKRNLRKLSLLMTLIMFISIVAIFGTSTKAKAYTPTYTYSLSAKTAYPPYGYYPSVIYFTNSLKLWMINFFSII